MKNLLNDQDPLPEVYEYPQGRNIYPDGECWVILPQSSRQAEEKEKIKAKKQGEDWKPYSPGLEINGKGQLRTKDYKPPEPPETDVILMIAEDCFEVFWPNNTPRQEWADRFLKDLDHIIPSAEWEQGEHRFKLFELAQVYT